MNWTGITNLIRQNHLIVIGTLFTIFVIIFLVILSVYSPSDQNTNNILVLSASSLSDALNELQKDFRLENDIMVNISYGGSQMLAQQISSGAPADIFISAGESPVIFLSNKNLIETQLALDLSLEEIKTLIINSFKSSFLKDDKKKEWIDKIN